MNCGDVCLAQFPFTDATSSKLRPILIVSLFEHNAGEDVVAIPISSSPDENAPFSIFVGEDNYSKASLKYPSAIKWNKPATISKLVIKKKLGVLPKEILDDVIEKLVSVFQS